MAILTALHCRYGSRVTFEKGAANSGSDGRAGVPHQDVAIRIPRIRLLSRLTDSKAFKRLVAAATIRPVGGNPLTAS